MLYHRPEIFLHEIDQTLPVALLGGHRGIHRSQHGKRDGYSKHNYQSL